MTTERIAELDAASNLGEFLLATGSRAPDVIWLIAMACGETVWNVAADPEGEGEPSVAYIRASEIRAHIDAQAAKIARLRETAKRIADHPNFYITACKCGEPECATTQFLAAITEAEGAA